LQLYGVAGRVAYFVAPRVFLRFVDRHRLTSWRGGPRSEARGPYPHGAHSRTIPPRPSSIPRKARPASPPPVASSPDPAGAVPDPGSRHP
jgi:hypothetical protein